MFYTAHPELACSSANGRSCHQNLSAELSCQSCTNQPCSTGGMELTMHQDDRRALGPTFLVADLELSPLPFTCSHAPVHA